MEQPTTPQENYVLGQKVTPAALYWMLITLGALLIIFNMIELFMIASISAKVSAICAHLHIVFYH